MIQVKRAPVDVNAGSVLVNPALEVILSHLREKLIDVEESLIWGCHASASQSIREMAKVVDAVREMSE